MKQETQEVMKSGMDALSVFTMLGALVEVLPSIAALFTIVWTGIRIYESETVKKFIQDWKNRAK
jgi:ABC-type phosphate transport system permease subunit